MRRATVHDLARTAGVSLATVDRVLNRRGGVRAATIEKVEQAVDRLGYRRDAVAETALGTELDRYRDIVGVYSVGAGNRGVLAALHKRGLAGTVCAIAHELTEHSRAALADGSFAAILCQDPGHEARSAVRILRALADGLPFDAGQERIRIDIYLRDNVP